MPIVIAAIIGGACGEDAPPFFFPLADTAADTAGGDVTPSDTEDDVADVPPGDDLGQTDADPDSGIDPDVEPDTIVEPDAEPDAIVEPDAEPPDAEPDAVVEPDAEPPDAEPDAEPDAVVEPDASGERCSDADRDLLEDPAFTEVTNGCAEACLRRAPRLSGCIADCVAAESRLSSSCS